MNDDHKVLIKPKSKEEKDYCQKYNIDLRRLDNGITIVGTSCKMDNTVFANITWRFPSGSYNNPPGQVHFFEHFFNKKIFSKASQNEVDVNASTSYLNLNQYAKGVANPLVLDFGIWTILKDIRMALESPIDNKTNIEPEKEVIKDELRRLLSDHHYYADRLLRDVVYDLSHPFLGIPEIVGTEKDIDNIKKDDLYKLISEILIPDGLLIGVYTEGQEKTAKMLCDQIEDLFKDFPREDKKYKKVDRSLLEKMNKNFKPGEIFTKNTGLKNGKFTTDFVWIVESNWPSIKHSSLNRLRELLEVKLHEQSRINGWAYDTRVFRTTPGSKYTLFMLRVDRHNTPAPSQFATKVLWPKIMTEVIKGLTPDEIDDFCKLEAKKQEAIPIRDWDRFGDAFGGLEDYGKIINSDRIKDIYKKITPKEIKAWIQKLLSTPPVILITGDLG